MLRGEFLAKLSELQMSTGPIELTIGGTRGGRVVHDVVTITNAPPAVFRAIQQLERHQVSIEEGGVTIHFGS